MVSPGLADRHDQRVGADHRVAVAELVRELDVDRDAGPLLDRVLADLAGVRRCAAGDHDDAGDAEEELVQPVELGDDDLPVAHAPAQGVGDGVGLFRDLLGHERRPAALLGGSGIPGHFERLDLDGVAREVGDLDPRRSDRDDLVLPDGERVAGVLDERRDVGAEEVLALAEPDHERRVAARADDEPGLVLVHREERECTLQARDDGAEGLDEVAGAVVLAAEQHGGDLGVGLAAEGEAVGEKLVLELAEVLDDAVVDDGELVVVGEVRVRVAVGRAAVGRPAGMADAGGAVGERPGGQVVAQHLQLARALAHAQTPVTVDHGDAGGVVAAVLEPREPRDQHGLARARAHVSDDSTHADNGRRGVSQGPFTNPSPRRLGGPVSAGRPPCAVEPQSALPFPGCGTHVPADPLDP